MTRTCTGECCWRFTLSGTDGSTQCQRELPEGLEPICYELFHQTETPFYFGCHAWNQGTWECEVYEWRPGLCRRHPQSRPCHYCGAADSDAAIDPPMIGLA